MLFLIMIFTYRYFTVLRPDWMNDMNNILLLLLAYGICYCRVEINFQSLFR